MKKSAILFFVLFAALSVQAQSPIAGIWETGQANTQVEIKEVNGQLEGVILQSDNANAPVGTQIIKDVKQDGNAYRGKLYAIKKGEWVDATITREGEMLNLKITSGWRSKTVEWEKAK